MTSLHSVVAAAANAQAEPKAAAGQENPYGAVPAASDGRSLIEQLQLACQKFEITVANAQDMLALSEYEIVFICDDSGSMSIRDSSGGCRRKSRWEELEDTIKVAADIAASIHPGGSDVYFLNRPGVTAVQSSSDPRLLDAFSRRPTGSTPLTSRVLEVVEAKREVQQYLLVIATDGEPNGGARAFSKALGEVVTKQRTQSKVRVQILACTDDDEAVGWLNQFDAAFKEIDVTDDFMAEQKEVLRTGRYPQFLRSDWITKALLGPIASKFDRMDEVHKAAGRQPTAAESKRQPAGPPPQNKDGDGGCSCSIQ